jgi:exodeoxyribonuclease VII large subunit
MFNEEGFSVSEFIELVNQTFELAYPVVNIIGELANLKISKNKWIYFDLKDENSSLKFFGTVYQLKDPLEEGMMLKVSSRPNLHNIYGFSMQVQNISLVGEGSIKRAAEILQIKLTKEGIFDVNKKRQLPYPPSKIGLITSSQSAAYHDFIKIINNRWRGIEINLYDVQVQGEAAPYQILQALEYFNNYPNNFDVLVIIRGGGSPEDLAAFSTESVTRAVSSSKVPTLVAIGHEIDVSLAELAADIRASTPSNAAELLVPDKKIVINNLKSISKYLDRRVKESISLEESFLKSQSKQLNELINHRINILTNELHHKRELLTAYDPMRTLKRGFSIVRKDGMIIRSTKNLSINDVLDINLAEGDIEASISGINGT